MKWYIISPLLVHTASDNNTLAHITNINKIQEVYNFPYSTNDPAWMFQKFGQESTHSAAVMPACPSSLCQSHPPVPGRRTRCTGSRSQKTQDLNPVSRVWYISDEGELHCLFLETMEVRDKEWIQIVVYAFSGRQSLSLSLSSWRRVEAGRSRILGTQMAVRQHPP